MTKRNELIEFKKEKLENIKYSGKTEQYFAENFEDYVFKLISIKKQSKKINLLNLKKWR